MVVSATITRINHLWLPCWNEIRCWGGETGSSQSTCVCVCVYYYEDQPMGRLDGVRLLRLSQADQPVWHSSLDRDGMRHLSESGSPTVL